jgi:hypothetical protein
MVIGSIATNTIRSHNLRKASFTIDIHLLQHGYDSTVQYVVMIYCTTEHGSLPTVHYVLYLPYRTYCSPGLHASLTHSSTVNTDKKSRARPLNFTKSRRRRGKRVVLDGDATQAANLLCGLVNGQISSDGFVTPSLCLCFFVSSTKPLFVLPHHGFIETVH